MKVVVLLIWSSLVLMSAATSQTTKNKKSISPTTSSKTSSNNNAPKPTRDETIKWLFETLENKIKYSTPSYNSYYSLVSYKFENNLLIVTDKDIRDKSLREFTIDFTKIVSAKIGGDNISSSIFLEGSKVLYNGVLREYFNSVDLILFYGISHEMTKRIEKAFTNLVELKKKDSEVF